MAKKKQEIRICSSYGIQWWLKTRHERAGRVNRRNPINRRNRNRRNPNHPNEAEAAIDLSERRMESSLKRCSAISNDKKDIAFNQTENTSNDKLNPTPVSAARHMESSLKRCSALSNDKDTAFNQTENTSNDKLNPTPVSAVHRKMGSDKDTGFSQLEKTVRAKSLVGLSRTHVFGCVTPYARALASRVGKGVLRLPLSEKAKSLVKRGMSVGLAVRTVGFQNAFTSWRDGASIYVYLRAKNGGLAVTKT